METIVALLIPGILKNVSRRKFHMQQSAAEVPTFNNLGNGRSLYLCIHNIQNIAAERINTCPSSCCVHS